MIEWILKELNLTFQITQYFFYNNIYDIIKNVLQIFPNKENKIFRTYMLGIDLDNYEFLINNTKILALFDTKNI